MAAGAPPELVPITAEVLAALALPPAALGRWLDEVEAFCHAHGGPRHYRDLLALIADARAAHAATRDRA